MKQYYQHKIILVTGAASGIGKRFAERVSNVKGVKLILWDLNLHSLQKIQEETGSRSEVHISQINVADSDRIEQEAELLIKQNFLPDLIINCAGTVTGKLFHEHSYQDIEQTLQINTAGSMYVVRAFLNEMIKRGSGHIVNLASASGYIGNPRMSVYAGSKWAILGWTESLYLEMKKYKTGIDVTAVIPGYIDTGMFEGVQAPLLTPILKTDDIAGYMLKGISRRKRTVKAPFMVRVTPLIKALLPAPAFDWIAGRVFGVYESMDSFKGRKR